MTLLPFVKSRHAIQSEVDVGLMADAGGVAVTASGVRQQRAPRTMPPPRTRQAVAAPAHRYLCRSAIVLAAVRAPLSAIREHPVAPLE
jgi:hypothetical protein